MAKIRICKELDCHNEATTEGYCRLHYLRHWRQIKEDNKKKAAKKLNKYIEHMMKRYPDRYVDAIKKDIRSASFGQFGEDSFDEDDLTALFHEPTYDEEIEILIKQLKIEKGY